MTQDDNAASRPRSQSAHGSEGPTGRDAGSGSGDGHWRRSRGRGVPAPVRFARSGVIEYDRVLFFSDAVFAISITLLAIDLKVPAPHSTQVVDKNGLVSFAISFGVIGLFWLSHHAIFRYIVALDRPLVGINLFFLGIVALLPYPTRLLEVGTSGTAQIVFYAACVAAAGLCECVIWLYATRPGARLAAEPAAAVRLRYSLRIARIPIVFLASIPVAFAWPRVAPFVWILSFVLGVLINRFAPQPGEPEPIGDDMRSGQP